MRLAGTGLFLALIASTVYGQPAFKPEIPKVWDDAALAEWATVGHQNSGELWNQ